MFSNGTLRVAPSDAIVTGGDTRCALRRQARERARAWRGTRRGRRSGPPGASGARAPAAREARAHGPRGRARGPDARAEARLGRARAPRGPQRSPHHRKRVPTGRTARRRTGSRCCGASGRSRRTMRRRRCGAAAPLRVQVLQEPQLGMRSCPQPTSGKTAAGLAAVHCYPRHRNAALTPRLLAMPSLTQCRPFHCRSGSSCRARATRSGSLACLTATAARAPQTTSTATCSTTSSATPSSRRRTPRQR